MRIAQQRDELLRHLHEQLRFLEASARAYDAGFEGEGKRLAVVLRVLLHDTKSSQSLLGTLGVKQSLLFQDVVGPVPDNALVFAGLSMGFTAAGVRYFPRLDAPKQRIPFDPWWNGLVLLQQNAGVHFTRRDAVLALANADGGAHVDPSLDAQYAALSRYNAFGWQVWRGVDAGIVENSPVLPIARQVAHEIAGTIREQLPRIEANS